MDFVEVSHGQAQVIVLARRAWLRGRRFTLYTQSRERLLDQAIRDGHLAALYRTFGRVVTPIAPGRQREEILRQIRHGMILCAVLPAARPAVPAQGAPPPQPQPPPQPAPVHTLTPEGDIHRDVAVGDEVTLAARAEPGGPYAWRVLSGNAEIIRGADQPSARVRCRGAGDAVIAVRHTALGTTLEAQFTLRATAYTWVWDAPHTQDREQFVNLRRAWDPHYGREVELVGHVEPRAAGQTVTFAAVPHAENDAETGAATLSAPTAVTAADGTARVRITLPFYGGSRFKVSGRTASMARAVESGTIRVWRKFFYHVTEMDPIPANAAAGRPHPTPLTAPADMITALSAAFTPVFIRFDRGTTHHSTTPYQEHLTAGQRRTLENSLKATVRDNRSPFKMNIVTIDKADIVAEPEFEVITADTVVRTPYFDRWTYEPTVRFAGFKRPSVAPLTPMARTDPAHPWTTLANVVEEVDPTNANRIRVKGEISGPWAPGTQFHVLIQYRAQRGTAGGWGGTEGTLFMCIGRDRRANPATPTGAQLQQALTHEIGHALGLVPTGAAWRDTDPRDNAYSLRHCGYRTAAPAREPRCVMWFMLGGSGERLRFCELSRPSNCGHHLRKTDYASARWI